MTDAATDTAKLRAHLHAYSNGEHARLADRPDEDLQAAIARARRYVGRRRLSWVIVAKNVLADGYPHP